MIEDGVFDAVKELRTWAQHRRFVRRLWVFGSRLKGVQHIDSDLDVALEIDAVGRDGASFTSWMSHHQQWQAELRQLVPYEVDLQLYDTTNRGSRIVEYVSCCGALVYERG